MAERLSPPHSQGGSEPASGIWNPLSDSELIAVLDERSARPVSPQRTLRRITPPDAALENIDSGCRAVVLNACRAGRTVDIFRRINGAVPPLTGNQSNRPPPSHLG